MSAAVGSFLVAPEDAARYGIPVSPSTLASNSSIFDELFARVAPLRFYQKEETRSLVARVCIVGALVSFIATGYVAFHFRAPPQVVQRVFFITLSLFGVFTGAAVFLGSLQPHPNDSTQHNNRKGLFCLRFPYISDVQLGQEYGSPQDSRSQGRILNAQFAAFKEKLRPFKPQYQEHYKDTPSLRVIEQEIYDSQAFQELCHWNSLDTLKHFPTTDLSNLGAVTAALWTPDIASTFKERCQRFSGLLPPTLPANEIFLKYRPLFRIQLNAALEATDKMEQLWPLLRYYEEWVFQDLPEDTQKLLLPQLRCGVRSTWQAEVFLSTTPLRRDSSSSTSRSVAERIYATLQKLTASTSFNFRSEIYLPLLAEAALDEARSWDEIWPHLPSPEYEVFLRLFSQLCPKSEPSANLIKKVKDALDVLEDESRGTLIESLASFSKDWQAALMQEIKELVVPGREASSGFLRSESQSPSPSVPPNITRLIKLLPQEAQSELAEACKLDRNSKEFGEAVRHFLGADWVDVPQ